MKNGIYVEQFSCRSGCVELLLRADVYQNKVVSFTISYCNDNAIKHKQWVGIVCYNRANYVTPENISTLGKLVVNMQYNRMLLDVAEILPKLGLHVVYINTELFDVLQFKND